MTLPLTFTQGQTVAITGPSGAGKSTLVEVLAGLDEVSRNKLSVNSIPISEMSARAHLTALRYCPQQPRFLEGPFERSVLFGSKASPLLHQAIRQLQLDEVVTQRNLSENASNISGGEAKRLSLLRLINRPGQFNLFDEPSASIEPGMAIPLWDLLFDTFGKRGVICATHDVRHLYRFDRVIIVRDGVIIADGPWCDLIGSPAVEVLANDLQEQGMS